MKKNILVFLFILIVSTFLILSTHVSLAQSVQDAVNGLNSSAKTANLVTDTSSPPEITDVIIRVVGYILSFVGVIFLIQVIIAGFSWMNAGGNEDVVKKAKTKIINSIIGIVIIFGAYILVSNIFAALYTI